MKILLTIVTALIILLMPQRLLAEDMDMDKVTMQAFMEMSVEDRLKVCESMVESQDIGACLSVKQGKENYSHEQIQAQMSACMEKGVGTPDDLAACVYQGLEMNSTASEITPEIKQQAMDMCLKHFSATNEVASCVTNVIPHLMVQQ